MPIQPYSLWLSDHDNDPSLDALLARYTLITDLIADYRLTNTSVPTGWLRECYVPNCLSDRPNELVHSSKPSPY